MAEIAGDRLKLLEKGPEAVRPTLPKLSNVMISDKGRSRYTKNSDKIGWSFACN